MKFITYLTKIMLAIIDDASIIKYSDTYILYRESDSIYLALKMGDKDDQQIYAQFLWHDYDKVETEMADSIIETQAFETRKIFKETMGLISSVCPTTIQKECYDIIRYNSSNLHYQDNGYTEMIMESTNLLLEQDYHQKVWFVKIGNTRICIQNENAARRLYSLIKKDIDNFIRLRWDNVFMPNSI